MKNSFVDKVYDTYLTQDYSFGDDNLNPLREISSLSRVDRKRGKKSSMDDEINSLLAKVANDTSALGSKYDNVNLEDADKILESLKKALDPDVNSNEINMGGLGTGSSGSTINPSENTAGRSTSERNLISAGGGNPNKDGLFDYGPLSAEDLDDLIRRQIDKILGIIKGIEQVTGKKFPSGGKVKKSTGGGFGAGGTPLSGRPGTGKPFGDDDIGKSPTGDDLPGITTPYYDPNDPTDPNHPNYDDGSGNGDGGGDGNGNSDSSAGSLSMLDINCQGVYTTNDDAGNGSGSGKGNGGSDSGVTDDEANNYFGDEADDEELSNLLGCVYKDLEWLQIFQFVAKFISTLKKIIDPAFNIIMTVVEIVVLAAGCWVNPTGAAKIAQLVIEQVMAILLKYVGILLQWVWKLIGLDCVCAESVEIINEIMAILALLEDATGEVNSMALKVTDATKGVTVGTASIIESLKGVGDNLSSNWEKFKESMPSGEEIGNMFIAELKGNGLSAIDEGSNGVVSQVYETYSSTKALASQVKQDWDKVSSAFKSTSKTNNAIGAIGSMFTGQFWVDAWEEGADNANKQSDMSGAISKAKTLGK